MFTIPKWLPTETSDLDHLTPPPVLCIIKLTKVLGCENSRYSSISAHTALLTPTFPHVYVCPFFFPLPPLVSAKALYFTGPSTVWDGLTNGLPQTPALPQQSPPLFCAVVTAAQNTTRHNTLLLHWCWHLNSGLRNCRGAFIHWAVSQAKKELETIQYAKERHTWKENLAEILVWSAQNKILTVVV